MICLIALFVFGILGIFSVTHRRLAIEAFDCVFRKVRFKPCNSDLDKRLKSQITGKLIRRTPRIAKFTYKNFEVISGIFVILMFVSFLYSGIAVYNVFVYDNCNGPHSDDFCIFNPIGSGEVSCDSSYCAENGCSCGEMEGECTPENNFSACNGNCSCNSTVCGGG